MKKWLFITSLIFVLCIGRWVYGENYYFTNFTSGVFSRKLDSRVDFEKFFNGARQLENMLVYPQGGAYKRPGLKYVSGVSNHAETVRLIPFVFSTEQAYIIEMGAGYARFYKDGGQIQTVDSYTMLLLHANGNDASTTFTDSGVTGYTVTAYDNAQIDTAQKKFGTASGLFDGTGDYLSVPDSPDWFMSTGAFTVDFWVRFNALPLTANFGPLFSQYVDGNNHASFYLVNNAGIYSLTAYCISSGVINININKTWTTPIINTWYHVALIRGWGGNADDWAITINGTQIGSTTTDADAWPNIANTFNIGKLVLAWTLNGWIDEFRVSKGIARWTANFTPPTVAYPSTETGGGEVSYQITTPPYSESQLPFIKHTQSADYLYLANPYVVPYTLTRTGHTSWTAAAFSVTAAPWSGTTGYPSAVEFHEERLCWSGTTPYPQTIWMSKSGDYDNYTTGASDDDAINLTIAASEVNAIRWMLSGKMLALGTTGGEWSIGPLDSTTPLTPSNIQAKRQTNYGSANIQAIVAGKQILHAQYGGKKLREYAYSWETDSYQSADLLLLAEHLTENTTIKEIAFQKTPNNILWCVLNDGDILALTYLRDQNVVAWSKVTTDGNFENVAVIPGPNNKDQVWVVVKRTVDGSDYRFIEYFEDVYDSDAEDSFYVDSGLSYDGAATTSVSGLDHLAGVTVSVLADGVYIGDQAVSAGGAISLATAASKIHAGLPYTATLETIDLPPGTGMDRRIIEVTPRFYRACQGEWGSTSADLDTIDFAASGTTPYTGSIDLPFPGGWKKDQTILFQSDEPLPFSISGILVRYQ